MAPSLTTQRGLPRKQPWFPCRRVRPEQARSAPKGWREVQERLRRRHLLCPRQHGRESGLHGNGSALSTRRAATHWRWWEGRGKASGWPRELGWWPHRRAHAESPRGGRAQWAGGDCTGSPWNRAEQGHRVRVSKKHSTVIRLQLRVSEAGDTREAGGTSLSESPSLGEEASPT